MIINNELLKELRTILQQNYSISIDDNDLQCIGNFLISYFDTLGRMKSKANFNA